MTDLNHIHAAIASLHPGATRDAYAWVRPHDAEGTPNGEPVMRLWNEDRLGSLDMDAIRAECERIEQAEAIAAVRAECDTRIAQAFAVDGVSRRGSMNTWAVAVLAQGAAGSQPAGDDATCLAMLPRLNAWEAGMFVERDRLVANGLTLAAAAWPALPDGAAAFVASCDQG